MLRVVVGLSLVPHGLRMSMGFFPNSGGPVSNVRDFATLLDNGGYRPGKLWAWVIVMTELVGGPMLALGLFTRPVAIPIVILLVLSIWEHRRSFFWNQGGFEYPLLWTCGRALLPRQWRRRLFSRCPDRPGLLNRPPLRVTKPDGHRAARICLP